MRMLGGFLLLLGDMAEVGVSSADKAVDKGRKQGGIRGFNSKNKCMRARGCRERAASRKGSRTGYMSCRSCS
jgi:hypothetical protein